jgi:hypothetical protein
MLSPRMRWSRARTNLNTESTSRPVLTLSAANVRPFVDPDRSYSAASGVTQLVATPLRPTAVERIDPIGLMSHFCSIART